MKIKHLILTMMLTCGFLVLGSGPAKSSDWSACIHSETVTVIDDVQTEFFASQNALQIIIEDYYKDFQVACVFELPYLDYQKTKYPLPVNECTKG